MPTRIRLGVSCSDSWQFFEPICERFKSDFEVVRFEERPGRLPIRSSRYQQWVLRRRMTHFLQQVDVAFFEWAAYHLVLATGLPKTCRIVTRLHQYELFKWSDRVAWLSLVKRLGLQDRVQFDGYIKDPASWFSKLDIFVSNSYSEGLQVAPMEASASGCYCVAHHWDGAEDYLSSDSLFLSEQEF